MIDWTNSLRLTPFRPTVTLAEYRQLDANRVIETIEKLHARILERFPGAGLSEVCSAFLSLARGLSAEASHLSKPAWGWRLATFALVSAGLLTQLAALRFFHPDGLIATTAELVQGLEAAVNLVILFGGAIWFLLTLEERAKRRRALDALHSLRALAHVIDMHQLTKDPTIILNERGTAASPARTMTRFELTRYLDYCAEMLALIGKIAALFADRTRDGLVIDAVNDIEDLTNGLGRKIWQKISILSALDDAPRSA